MLTIDKKYVDFQTGLRLYSQGIVIHETANPGASAMNHYKYIQNSKTEVFAHVYLDSSDIIQVAPLNMQCYHASSPANEMFIGIEICHADTRVAGHKERFLKMYETAAEFCAYYLRNTLKTLWVTTDNIKSHHEVSLKWGNTDHTDPTVYFARYGKSIDTFRQRVQEYIWMQHEQQAENLQDLMQY